MRTVPMQIGYIAKADLVERLTARSLRAIVAAERNLPMMLGIWLIALGLIAFQRVTGIGGHISASNVAIHMMLLLSPILGIALAAHVFPRDMIGALPTNLLARIGRWRQVDPVAAQAHRHYGAGGAMAALSIGLLLNVVIRTAEFLVAIPAITGEGPTWAYMMFLAFGIDCILFNILYAGTFILAVRHVPLFPRVLLLIWTLDLLSQLAIAKLLGTQPLPGQVSTVLSGLLTGNMQKTLISMAIWLPYLLLSVRVNVTYRRRIPR